MNLNKTMKHFGLAGTGVIVLLLMVVVYYLHLIEENTSLEAFSVGAQNHAAAYDAVGPPPPARADAPPDRHAAAYAAVGRAFTHGADHLPKKR